MALGRVIKSFAAPGGQPRGICYDGKYLWHVDAVTDLVYQIDPNTGSIIQSFASPSDLPIGIAWDGKYLWIYDNNGNMHQVDPDTGANPWSFALADASGVTFDGHFLWVTRYNASRLLQINPNTGTQLPGFAFPPTQPRDICWDGEFLWVCSSSTDRFYKINPMTGAIVASAPTPGALPTGITWDGEHLWIVDFADGLIYQVEASPNIIASAIRALGPIGQWGLWEAGGAVAYDISGNSPAGERNGTHVGITHHDAPGPGDGSMAPMYDAVNDYTDIRSAGLDAAFNGAAGAVLVYYKMLAAGVWTDGALRVMMELFVDVNNFVRLNKGIANNQVQLIYRAGAVSLQRAIAGITSLEWQSLGMTWDAVADEVVFYQDNALQGAILPGLGVWAPGAFARAVIGAISVVPASVHSGWLAQGAIFDRPITQVEFAGLPRGGP